MSASGSGPDDDIREASPADLDAIYAIHCSVYEALPDKRYYYRHPRSFFERLLHGEGFIHGVHVSGQLVGYAATAAAPCLEWLENYALGGTGIAIHRTAVACGSGILTEFRREGRFRRLLQLRSETAVARGADAIASIVWPAHAKTLRLMHDLGHLLVALHEDNDGTNFLFLHAPKASMAERDFVVEIPLEAPQRMIDVLKAQDLTGVPIPGTLAYGFVAKRDLLL